MSTIASGALLLSADPADSGAICAALAAEGIPCTEIGLVEDGPQGVWQEVHGERQKLPRPDRDDIARVYESI